MTPAVQVRPVGPEAKPTTLIDDGPATAPESARFNGVGFQVVVEQFQASPLLAEGKVNVIALDAIAERLGGRWAARQALIHDHAEKVLRRELGPDATVQRLNDTEYLVVQPDDTRLAGQARCLNGLRQILLHFLGAAAVADIRVHSVIRITPEGVFGQRLDVDAVEAEQAAASSRGQEEAPCSSKLDRWTPFVTSTGLQVSVTCSLEPVLQLKTYHRIGYRIARRVVRLPDGVSLCSREFERLSQRDLEKIDLATMARGIELVRAATPDSKPSVLVLPVSHAAMQSLRGRATVAALLRQGRKDVHHGLICELFGFNGASIAALLDTIATLRPFCLHVIGHLDAYPAQDIRGLDDTRLNGLSVQCPPDIGDAEFIGWVRSFVNLGRRVSKVLFIDQVPSLGHARLAASLGISHATLALRFTRRLGHEQRRRMTGPQASA